MAQAPVGVGMIGCGTVGAGVAMLLREQASLYAQRVGRPVVLRKVLVRDAARANRQGGVEASLLTQDPEAFFSTPNMPIVIEVAGGTGAVSDYVRRALTMGKHVVTANKSLLASEGPDLFALGHQHGASIAFEASCGGGIPIITALSFGLMANRIDALYGILNGTCNYILTEMAQKGKSYPAALKEAQELGFAEADPTLDVSGRDAAQKLAVLASLAFGADVRGEQVWSEGIDGLDVADIRYGAELGYTVKLLAIAQRVPGTGAEPERLSLRVHPCFLHSDLPLAQVHGSFNALSVFGHATGQTLYYGRGAGRLPTASAVVSDVLNIASGWYPQAFTDMKLWHTAGTAIASQDVGELTGRYYLRISSLDVPGVMAKLTAALGDADISISAVLQHEAKVGQFVPVVITTHAAPEAAMRRALATIRDLDVVEGEPVCIRVLDIPEG